MEQCIFCGGAADTDEHVIPNWMQREFDLNRKTLKLPNLTSFRYLHAKAPACNLHNGKFGDIENKLKNRTCTLDEIYLWAFKVHAGLIYIDSKAKANVSNPFSGSLIPAEIFQNQIEHFREIFRVWSSTNHRFVPSPLGSVFTLPALAPNFDLIHSYLGNCLGVSLGDVFLAVFFYDHGHAMRAERNTQWKKLQAVEHQPDVSAEAQSELERQQRALSQAIWLCETAYWVSRLELPSTVFYDEHQYFIPNYDRRPKIRPENDTEFLEFSQSFGLQVVKNDEGVVHYEPLPGSGFYADAKAAVAAIPSRLKIDR